jgi:transketolase
MSAAMRDYWGQKLAAAGAAHKNIIVLDADVSSSTRSNYFSKAFPNRFFNCGVAEGNMTGTAAGLAASGFHPVINTFAVFIALKCIDQLRHDFCYNKLPVIIGGGYGGLSDAYDGPSHQAVADIAILRALPNMEVIVPCDKTQVELAVDYALTRQNPVYIRISRLEAPDIPGSAFASPAPVLLREGADVTVAVTGTLAGAVLEAADILLENGIHAEVFSVPFVKPLDSAPLAESLKKTGRLVTVEEHSIVGGFGSACLEKLALDNVSFKYTPVGIQDTFGNTGSYPELLAAYGLDAAGIAAKISGG